MRCASFSFHSAKIKNIISTEDAKARLLAEQQNKKKDSETSFVPTNMAVNYVQHNRCECPACPTPHESKSPTSCLMVPCSFSAQFIMKSSMHPSEETKKSPKPGPCEWVTQRSRSLNVSTALGGT